MLYASLSVRLLVPIVAHVGAEEEGARRAEERRGQEGRRRQGQEKNRLEEFGKRNEARLLSSFLVMTLWVFVRDGL